MKKELKMTVQEFNKWIAENDVISYISMYHFNGGAKNIYRIISSIDGKADDTMITLINLGGK